MQWKLKEGEIFVYTVWCNLILSWQSPMTTGSTPHEELHWHQRIRRETPVLLQFIAPTNHIQWNQSLSQVTAIHPSQRPKSANKAISGLWSETWVKSYGWLTSYGSKWIRSSAMKRIWKDTDHTHTLPLRVWCSSCRNFVQKLPAITQHNKRPDQIVSSWSRQRSC
jgi:hypothetical protein